MHYMIDVNTISWKPYLQSSSPWTFHNPTVCESVSSSCPVHMHNSQSSTSRIIYPSIKATSLSTLYTVISTSNHEAHKLDVPTATCLFHRHCICFAFADFNVMLNFIPFFIHSFLRSLAKFSCCPVSTSAFIADSSKICSR